MRNDYIISILIRTEISIDVVEMIAFKGVSFSMTRNTSRASGNDTLTRSQIGFPASLFRDTLNEKLASGKQAIGNQLRWLTCL